MNYNNLNYDEISSIRTSGKNIEGSSESKEKYAKLYNTYRGLLTEYLIKKLELKKYDDEFTNSEFNFSETPEEKMDEYQYFSSPELRYFYLRNNVYIERLEKEELEELKRIAEENQQLYDQNTEKFIETTYPKVTKEVIYGAEEPYLLQFGPFSPNFMANNDSIVIGFRYDEFNLNGMTDEQWFKNNIKQLKFSNSTLKELQENVKEKLGKEVKIIRYSDNSVRPRTSGQNEKKNKNDKEIEK